MDKIPVEFWEADDRVWRSVLAHIVLSRRERDVWHNLSLTESNRTEWLLTRLVAKDAVRLLMNEYYGLDLWPADIEIQNDTGGRFKVALNSVQQSKHQLYLSTAHSQGVFIAFAVECIEIFGAGIEIQPIRSVRDSVLETYFSNDEDCVIAELDAPDDGEWITRMVAAKEALRKAFDIESTLSPMDVCVREMDMKKGEVILGISDKFAHVLDESQRNLVKVNTLRNGDFIAACALIGKGVRDG
jgi:phosphopantetheinyl transferase (holo-ACP synthase)